VLLPDINVLVGAHRGDAPEHQTMRGWLESALLGDEPVALCGPVMSGFLRISTHPRVFDPPTPASQAFAFLDAIRARPTVVTVREGERHWGLLKRLCLAGNVKGALFGDAYLAATAVEHNCVLVSADRDFARFPMLRWRNPLHATS
jgi:uncharacterized protein